MKKMQLQLLVELLRSPDAAAAAAAAAAADDERRLVHMPLDEGAGQLTALAATQHGGGTRLIFGTACGEVQLGTLCNLPGPSSRCSN